MKILVINAGSSSLKYQLFDMKDESVIAKGNCQKNWSCRVIYQLFDEWTEKGS